MKLQAVTSVKILTAAIAMTTAASAFAQSTGTPQPLNYNYVGAQFISQEVDDYDCTQDGVNLTGSMDINNGWFGQLNYTDVSGGGCGSSTISVLGGYRQPFNDMFYWFGQLGIDSLSVDGPGGDDSGVVLAGGLRGFMTDQIETTIQISHHTVGDGNTMISGTGAYYFQPNIAGTLNLGLSGEITQIAIGARLTF